MVRRRRMRQEVFSIAICMGCLLGLTSAMPLRADKPPVGKRNVDLWPPPEQRDPNRQPVTRYRKDGWQYEAYRGNPRDGVPWELVVSPDPENAGDWQLGDPQNGLPNYPVLTDAQQIQMRVQARKKKLKPGEQRVPITIPVIKLPEFAWRSRFPLDFTDVVGVHYHEYVSEDFAQILFTIHKVPADGPDGKPPANFEGKAGTRLEATLMVPVLWHLDQTIVVRDDNMQIPNDTQREPVTQSRIDHEWGHADVSRQVFVRGLQGQLDWNPERCSGRRMRMAYYWKREIIGRTWKGYQGGKDKLRTLRTTIALVPPTRWSKLLPIPPERITQRHIDTFNEEIVEVGPILSATDKKAQDDFHAHHGSFGR